MFRQVASASCLAFVLCGTVNLAGQELFEEASDSFARQIDHVYKAGLDYLAKSQNERGCWADNNYGAEPGVVGLSTLALLARGDDPDFGPYRVTVKRALDFILSRQDKSTGYIGSS
ncbi:uncharacterized protein METZ01_LOCUS334526, partial [marine metagenome]